MNSNLRAKVIEAICFRPGIAGHLEQFERVEALIAEAQEAGAIKQRDWASTQGRPLSDAPEIEKQPVACPGCKAESYADWTLYPHQLYNSYMPGGIGHYCFPCFCKIVAG
jgi:hypothetical protein